MAYTIKQHDNFPDFVATVSDANGLIDLTDATSVKLILKSDAVVIDGIMAIDNAVGGGLSYEWAAGDTDVAGIYDGEIEITWSTGKIETVPNDSYFTVTIVADLG